MVDIGEDHSSKKAGANIDYFSSSIYYIQERFYHHNSPYSYHVPAHNYYAKHLLPARTTLGNPSTAICSVRVYEFELIDKANRVNTFASAIAWAPNGRRLLCASGDGHFHLFNGHSFNSDSYIIAHPSRLDGRPSEIDGLAWGPRYDYILSSDNKGYVQMWKSNLTQLAGFTVGTESPVSGIDFAPGEEQFVTGSDDGTARLWDTNTVGRSGGRGDVKEVRGFDHGSRVSSVHWHPHKALLLTASKDANACLWDPRVPERLLKIQEDNGAVTCARWDNAGQRFLTANANGAIYIWDIRALGQQRPQTVVRYPQAHSGGVTAVAWHPQHQGLLASAGADGSIKQWIVAEGQEDVKFPTHEIKNAHSRPGDQDNRRKEIRAIAWSPYGHVLVSGSTDLCYFMRSKPGFKIEE